MRNLASTEMYMSAVERLRNYSKLPIEEQTSKNCESNEFNIFVYLFHVLKLYHNVKFILKEIKMVSKTVYLLEIINNTTNKYLRCSIF